MKTKYYIDHEPNTYSYGDRYWFLMHDERGLYCRYYYDDHKKFVKHESATMLTGSDFESIMRTSKEVTEEEWEEVLFSMYL